MLKDVGMAVPKTRETRSLYMLQNKRLWHTIIIPCITPILKRDVGREVNRLGLQGDPAPQPQHTLLSSPKKRLPLCVLNRDVGRGYAWYNLLSCGIYTA